MISLKKITSFIQKKIKRLINGKTLQTKRAEQWFKANGEGMRRDYELSNTSLILDVGGYEGEWADDMSQRYDSFIYIFEPVAEFCDIIRKKLNSNQKITLFSFGLSGKTVIEEILLDNNSSSLFDEGVRKGSRKETIQLVSGSEFFTTHEIDHIDLMKINIEGGEYDLLEDLISHDLVKNIDNIQVQFHDFVPNAEDRMKKIQKSLRKTHHPTYQYPFVWENWKLTE
jgi:FkbM family methyltransferase